MYYKIKASLEETYDDIDNLFSVNEEVGSRLAKAKNNKYRMYLTTIKKKEVHGLAITNIYFDQNFDIKEEAKLYLEGCFLAVSHIEVKCIDYYDFFRQLRTLDFLIEKRSGSDTTVLIESYELNQYVLDLTGDHIDVSDIIVDSRNETLKSLTLKEGFEYELERMATNTNEKFIGHPVHYLIQSHNKKEAEELCKSLVYHLHKNHRLVYSRLLTVEIECRRNFNEDCSVNMQNVLTLAEGGAIMINLKDDSFDDIQKTQMVELIEEIAKNILSTRHSILYVLYSDNKDGKVINVMLEALKSIGFVKFEENSLDRSQGTRYLESIIEDKHLDASLAVELMPNDKDIFTPNEISILFANWYETHLKEKTFSQYRNIRPFEKKVLDEVQGDAYQELMALVGLENVKSLVNDFINAQKAFVFYDKVGIKIPRVSKHMLFTGSPGTAKTTVARLLGRIMKDNGLLSVGDFFEVGRADLVERFTGWTARNVKKYFKMAKGSILFIDEAYSLVEVNEGIYGDEAINTIVQEMENNRDDIIVIFAGYPKQMTEFIAKNPGLKSRVNYTIEFKDYTIDELEKIAVSIVKERGFTLSDAALERIVEITKDEMSTEDYGNGRFIRNLVDRAIIRHGSRLFEIGFKDVDDADICFLKEEDIPTIKQDFEPKKFIYWKSRLS